MQTMAAALITAVFLAIPFLGPLPGAEAGPARVVPKGGMLFPPGDPTGARRLAAARLQWNLVETGRASVIPGPAAWNLANLTGKSFRGSLAPIMRDRADPPHSYDCQGSGRLR